MSLVDDMRGLRNDVRALAERVDQIRLTLDRHEEQISGKRGLSVTLETLLEEFRASRQGLSKGERIALVASGTGFVSALIAAYAVLSGSA